MRRVAGFLGAISTLLLVAVVGVATPASAAELSGPPDAAGQHAYCNVDRTGPDNSVTFLVACQYGPTTLTPHDGGESSLQLHLKNGAVDKATPTMINAGWGPPTSPAAGQFRAEHVAQNYSFATPWDNYDCQLTQSGAKPCTVLEVTSTGSPPLMPFDNWPGGSPGQAPTETQAGSCVVLAEQASGTTYRARLRATVDNPDPSDVLTVDHGDGTGSIPWTSGTAYWHYFPAPDPGDTFTVVYTVERDDQDPITCTLSVNFFDDALDAAVFGTGAADPGEDDDASSCSWFDIVCWLRKLFIPNLDGALAESWATFATAAAERWPTGPLVWMGATAQQQVDAVMAGWTGFPGLTHAPSWAQLNGCAGSSDVAVVFSLVFPNPLGGNFTANVPVVDNCPDSVVAVLQEFTFWVGTVGLVVGFVFFVRKRVVGVTGGSDE